MIKRADSHGFRYLYSDIESLSGNSSDARVVRVFRQAARYYAQERDVAAAGLAVGLAGTMNTVAQTLHAAAEIIEKAAICRVNLRELERQALSDAIVAVQALFSRRHHEVLAACAQALRHRLSIADSLTAPRSAVDELELVQGATLNLRGQLQWRVGNVEARLLLTDQRSAQAPSLPEPEKSAPSKSAADEQAPTFALPVELQPDVDALVAAVHRRSGVPPTEPLARVRDWLETDEEGFEVLQGSYGSEGFTVLWRGTVLPSCSDYESEWEGDVDPADLTDDDRIRYIRATLRQVFECELETTDWFSLGAFLPLVSSRDMQAGLGYLLDGGGCRSRPQVTWHGVYRTARGFRAALRRQRAILSLRDASVLSRAELLGFWEGKATA